MNITAFRYLSALSKFLPALIALGVNAILFWGAVRATSVLPPERVSRISAAAVDSRDRSGRRDARRTPKNASRCGLARCSELPFIAPYGERAGSGGRRA
jgi:hypothetical protein